MLGLIEHSVYLKNILFTNHLNLATILPAGISLLCATHNNLSKISTLTASPQQLQHFTVTLERTLDIGAK